MRLTSTARPAAATPLALIAGSPACTALPAPLRAAVEARLAHDPLAALPTLGLIPQPLLVVAKPPAWDDPVAVRRRGGAIARALWAERVTAATLVLPPGLGAEAAGLLLAGLGQGAYAWQRHLDKPRPVLERVGVAGAPRGLDLAAISHAIAATVWVRDLVNTPAEDKGPARFVEAARRFIAGSGVRLRLLDEAGCRKAGLGCLLAVGRASPRRPCLLYADWPGSRPRRGGAPDLALCGKGVCFDTGGLDIKTSQGMELMRKDMAGAATCLAALTLIARARSPRAVRAYLPLADNAIDGGAFRPGDVLTACDGTTVEVASTDAEGRLLLADAIAQARADGAARIVSVATLTGAALTALGRVHVPLMGTDADLLHRVETAARAAGEKVWRLPLEDEHRAMVRGKTARLTNCAGGEAACITAGAFLAHFAAQTPFAHLDISPCSWQVKAHDLGGEGATGVMLATLAGLA